MIGPRPLDREIVSAAGLSFQRLNVGGVHGMAPWQAIPNLARFALAIPRAALLLRRFRPDLVLVGGGYVCAPISVAAWALRLPMLTVCMDVVPGWALRLSARLSTGVVTAFPQSLAALPAGKTLLTGYPVREEFARADRRAARQRLGLPDDELVVVAFGGSLGARSINRAVTGALEQLLPIAQVIHVTGRADGANGATPRPLPDGLSARYHPHTYLDAGEMADALAAADLAICRAGAAAMAELPMTGTPAILVPGQFSAQEDNARGMAASGVAVMIRDAELSAARLAAEAVGLLKDRGRLEAMAAACRGLAHHDAAEQIAARARELAGYV